MPNLKDLKGKASLRTDPHGRGIGSDLALVCSEATQGCSKVT